jgi:hypothetical protein
MAQTGARSIGATNDHARGGDRGVTTREDRRGLTPAQLYCLLAGAALLLAGIGGFFADATFDTDNGLQGDSFLGFEVNGWHNVVHIASGLLLLASYRRRASAKTVALAFGIVYGIVSVIGLVDGNDVLTLIPVNPADNVLHIALSLVGILAALASPADRDELRTSTATPNDERFGRGDGVGVHGREPVGTTTDTTTGRASGQPIDR